MSSITELYWRFVRQSTAMKLIPRFAFDFRFASVDSDFQSLESSITGKGDSRSLDLHGDGKLSFLHSACYGYGASRRMSSSKIASDSRETLTTNSLFDDDHPLINAEEWLLQADYASSKDKRFSTHKRQVEEIILKLLPDVSAIEYKVDKQSAKVLFETPTGWVGIDQLSLGYRTIMAWMVDFAAGLFAQYPDSENPLEEPAVLLVDEIDLHLHPRWQRTVIDFLTQRFPNTQFIVTAHSPLLVQTAADSNLILLKRKRGDIVIDNNPVSVQNWRVDQILTSDLFGIESPHSANT